MIDVLTTSAPRLRLSSRQFFISCGAVLTPSRRASLYPDSTEEMLDPMSSSLRSSLAAAYRSCPCTRERTSRWQ
jgi:hypothetical protein